MIYFLDITDKKPDKLYDYIQSHCTEYAHITKEQLKEYWGSVFIAVSSPSSAYYRKLIDIDTISNNIVGFICMRRVPYEPGAKIPGYERSYIPNKVMYKIELLHYDEIWDWDGIKGLCNLIRTALQDKRDAFTIYTPPVSLDIPSFEHDSLMEVGFEPLDGVYVKSPSMDHDIFEFDKFKKEYTCHFG